MNDKIIEKIVFQVFSPETIRRMAAAKITQPDTYDDDGYPIDGGLMDLRLGVIDPGLRCKTCGARAKECPGHFGYIDLVRPVIHPSFSKVIHYFLTNTCEKCKAYKGRAKECPVCGAKQPEIKLVKPTSFYKNDQQMLPNEVRDWLSKIDDQTVRKLGYDPEVMRPEWLVLTVLPVPPVNLRPSIILQTGERSEDDLTHKLVDIIRSNQKLESHINAGTPQLIIEDMWELLQYHVTTYFDNETANVPPARHRSGRPLKTLAQRLKGKEGRFRYNLSGKRVNFSSRTVVSPDPNIELYEVGVPKAIAEILTVPITVTSWNIEEVKKYIKNKEYPRALYAIRKDKRKLKVNDVTRERILEEIEPGWVIERQLIDGDIALFNRQPSLHRISMMGHRVKVMDGKTFRVNPLVTPPYNADFDGDEMNLHIIQKEEAQAEALELMSAHKQILSPRHGHAIIKPQEDGISGIYFLTDDKAWFTKDEATRIAMIGELKKLPKPNKDGLYSGKDLFSMLLPEKLSFKTHNFSGIVEVKKGKLIKGAIDSKVMDKNILEYVFLHEGPEFTQKLMDRATRMGLEALTLRGISISMKNYVIRPETQKEIKERLEKMDREIENVITQYKQKTLERLPGTSRKETLESLIMQITGNARKDIGKIIENEFGKENSSIIMASIGARGSMLNVIQMSAVIAQQAIRNKRPERGYRRRNLPFYMRGKLTGRERGFVYSNFRKGLEPDEFWHHAMGGRESIVNTAIRTGRSGYMQRRLINALQDLIVFDDLTVRDSSGTIVQTIYGGDGKDPMLAGVSKFEVSVKQDDVDTA